jgi:glutamyl-tRNA synthetase
MSQNTVVTRFAPSPTGYLHVGGARTALFNWLAARHAGGKFLLRIEDTDLARSTQASVDALLDDLRWLKLDWDNAELVFQSKRLDIYNQLIDGLIADGRAYEAWETSEELEAQRKQAERAKRPYIYRRPTLTDEQIRNYRSEGRQPVVRFVMPPKEMRFRDEVLNKDIVVGAQQVQDFVIRKTDGMPTYHFAVVVDDAAMNVTHILRGQEHLLNTINHIGLQEALGYARPLYGHLPVILNIDGSKMGKRDRDKKVRHHTNLMLKAGTYTAETLADQAKIDRARLAEWLAEDTRQLDLDEHTALMPLVGLREVDLPEVLVHDFRRNGYFPEVLLNFLALLGWSPGGDRERMTIDEMVSLFELSGIGKSNAKFNRDKLLAFNTEAIAAAGESHLLGHFKDFLAMNPESRLNGQADPMLQQVLHMSAGMHTLREADDKAAFLFVPDAELHYQPVAVEKVLLKNEKQGLNALRGVAEVLRGAGDWTTPALESAVKTYCEQTQLGLGKVAQPIRVAVSGSTVSPPIFETLEVLGRERSLARIDRCLELVK